MEEKMFFKKEYLKRTDQIAYIWQYFPEKTLDKISITLEVLK